MSLLLENILLSIIALVCILNQACLNHQLSKISLNVLQVHLIDTKVIEDVTKLILDACPSTAADLVTPISVGTRGLLDNTQAFLNLVNPWVFLSIPFIFLVSKAIILLDGLESGQLFLILCSIIALLLLGLDIALQFLDFVRHTLLIASNVFYVEILGEPY